MNNWILFVFYTITFLALQCQGQREDCDTNVSLDVVFALDATASMQRDVPNVRRGVPELMDLFEDRFPGSRYGVTTYTDEDTRCRSITNERNWCPRLEVALTREKSLISAALNRYTARAGDSILPEDTLGALVVASQDPAIGWRESSKRLVKVIVCITDAAFRFPGDFPNRQCPAAAGFLRPNDGQLPYACFDEDFPTVELTHRVLQRTNVVPLFLIQPVHAQVYQNLIKELGGFGGYSFIAADSSNLVEVISNSIDEIVCLPPRTTTIGPGGGTGVVAAGVTGGVLAAALVVGGAAYAYQNANKPTNIEGNFEGDDIEDDVIDKEMEAHLGEEEFA